MSSLICRALVIILPTALIGTLVIPAMARDPNASGVWRQLVPALPEGPAAPAARKHHVMVFDHLNNQVLMYGGEDHSQVFGDVWALKLDGSSQWEEINPTEDDSRPVGFRSPGKRHGHSGAFGEDRMMILGGRTHQGDYKKDSWSLTPLDPDQYQWMWQSDGPDYGSTVCASDGTFSLRTHSAAAFLGGNLYFMGGREFPGGAGMRDTWKIGAPEPFTWRHVSGETSAALDLPSNPPGCGFTTLPNFRYWHSMIADTRYDRLIIFGGLYDDASSSNAWASRSDGNWDHIGNPSDGELGRMFHTAVYDPVGQRMVVLGGKHPVTGVVKSAVTSLKLPEYFATIACCETFGGEWSTLVPDLPSTGPGPITEHTAVYDSNSDRMIVFGGVYDETVGGELRPNDVWVLEFNTIPPAAITNLSTGSWTTSSTLLSWTAPGDDGSIGTAASYDVRGSTSPITAANFSSAGMVADTPPNPAVAGTNQSMTVTGLSPGITYYFAIKTSDDAPNTSAISNVVSGTILPDATPPAAVTLSGVAGKTTSTIAWLAPGDDGNTGTATYYQLRRSLTPITSANFGSAAPVATGAPQAAGSPECASAFPLVKCKKYYYALKSFDEAGNASALSNILTLTQTCSGGEPADCAGPQAPSSFSTGIDLRLETENPARGRSILSYEVSADLEGEAVEVGVFDLAGRRVRTLQGGQAGLSGHSISWDHVAEDGGRVPAGLYFVLVRVGSITTSQRIIVTR